jgi:hypothetical protein
VEPKSIDFRGDFNAQLERLLAAVRLTQEEVATLSGLYADLEIVLRLLWPGTLHCFTIHLKKLKSSIQKG